MTICNSTQKFEADPENYLLLVDSHGKISAEKKGAWTWIKANIFWKGSYKLENITAQLESVPFIESHELIKKLEYSIESHNKRHAVTRKKLIVLKNERNSFIEKFVHEHLTPYCDGRITAEAEDRERKPLIELLFLALTNRFPAYSFDKESIQKFALTTYIYEAVYALNRSVNQLSWPRGSKKGGATAVPVNPDDIEDASHVKVFISSLQHALQIDFKEMHLSSEEITARGIEALRDIFYQHIDRS